MHIANPSIADRGFKVPGSIVCLHEGRRLEFKVLGPRL